MGAMTDYLVVYIEGKSRGLDYNPMYKFKNPEDLIKRVETKTDVPETDEKLIEGYSGDNLIMVNKTFGDFIENVKFMTGL